MEQRLTWVRDYERERNAAAICRRHGITAATLRKWWRRYEAKGEAGLIEQSRAPATSPQRKAHASEVEAILALRREGLGFLRIQARLRDERGLALSLATIRRILARAETPALPRETRSITEPARRAEGVAAQLAEAIHRGQFRPGEKLAEEVLAKRFGIGRTRMREALRSLAFLGMVRIARNRGAFVSAPSAEEIAQAYQARRIVEAGILRDIGRLTPAQVATLEAHIRQQEDAEAAGQQVRLVQLLTEFHLVLAGMSRNGFLQGFLGRLTATTSLGVLVYDHAAAPSCAVQEHRALLGHLQRGETAQAVTLMLHHLGTNQARVEEGEALIPAPEAG